MPICPPARVIRSSTGKWTHCGRPAASNSPWQEKRRATWCCPSHGQHMPSHEVPDEIEADFAGLELAELRRQVTELRRAVRARDDFIAIAAHELRNPMTPL